MLSAKKINVLLRGSLCVGWLPLLFLLSTPAYANTADSTKTAKKERIKTHLKQHYKPYGFVRNFFAFDSRECLAGSGDLFMYLPKDNKWNQTEEEAAASGLPREDLNANSTFRFLSLTTRVGLNIVGYKYLNTEFGGKIEADFYAGMSKVTGQNHSVTGTAQLRLRQAYLTMAWDSLPMGTKDLAKVELLLGQTWHPFSMDLPDVIALNNGAPFQPFCRTPQVRMNARLGQYVSLMAAAIWQMQYVSTGPQGASAEYIAYGKTPEAYLGLNVHDKGVLFRAGADVLSIRPRHEGTLNGVKIKVKDRITTVSPFLYLQYKKGEFSIKAKTVFAQAGEHMNLNGGYGVKAVNADGSWSYTPTLNSTSWISLVYGGNLKNDSKLQGILYGGYVRNFGPMDEVIDADGDGKKDLYFSKNSFTNLNRMWRLSPTLLWTIGKFQLGCEYEITSVQYDAHWVTNHRVQVMTKYNF